MASASTSTEIAGYPVIQPVGEPAEGLFLAKDPTLGRTVTLKILSLPAPADPVGVVDFVDRARNAARLSNPHLLEVFDFVEHEGRWYAVLEAVKGESLKARGARAAFTVVNGSKAVGQAIEALSVIHGAGRAHGAVTVQNLFLVEKPGGGEMLKLLDFGAASGQSEIVEFTSLAPEQKGSGEPAESSDVWGLGSVLFELLEGRSPNEARRLGTTARSGEPIPESLALVVTRALENEPRSRFSSLETLSAAIAHAVGLGPQPLPTETSLANLKAVSSQRPATALAPIPVAPIAQVQQPVFTPSSRAAIVTSEIPRAKGGAGSQKLLLLIPVLAGVAAAAWWAQSQGDAPALTAEQPEAAAPVVPAAEPARVVPEVPAIDPMLSENAVNKMLGGARRVVASLFKGKPAKAAKPAKKKKR